MSEQVLEQLSASRAARQPILCVFEGVRLLIRSSIPPEVLIRRLEISDLSAAELRDRLDEVAFACLAPESHDAWRKLRDPSFEPPLSYSDIISLCDDFIAQASRLPTERPGDSQPGPEPAPPSSTAGSSSRAGTRKR